MSAESISAETLNRLLPGSGANSKVIQLAGDASTRSYYRVVLENGGSMVVMSAKDSAETANFVAMTELMKKLGADVPAIIGVNCAFLALEDLGDTLLQNHLTGMSDAEILAEYRLIIDDLIRFQRAAASHADRSSPCWGLSFDVEKLSWEVEFANTHFIRGYLRIEPRPDLTQTFASEWKMIVADLASEMETLAHRDFHSRNIMAIGSRRVWIDYQDARMGRRLYDLVSLLLDPYVALSPPVIESLADYYYIRLADNNEAPWDRERFNELFVLSGLQRIYKALGTYGYQTTVRGVDVYIPYIEPSMKTLLRLTQARSGFKRINGVFREIFPVSL